PFKPTCGLRVQSSIPATLRLLNRFWIFWIPTESALKSRNHFAMRPPFFRSSSSQQNSDCQLQLLPTTVHLAPTTHLRDRSLRSYVGRSQHARGSHPRR